MKGLQPWPPPGAMPTTCCSGTLQARARCCSLSAVLPSGVPSSSQACLSTTCLQRRLPYCNLHLSWKARTAIGFSASPVIQTYMTPNHSPGVANYVSMGGAGFIYPEVRHGQEDG
eukprot:351017-Chlamydomonas_euryale.AAC.11